MEISESESQINESTPDGVKKRMRGLIDWFKLKTGQMPSQTNKTKNKEKRHEKNNVCSHIYDFKFEHSNRRVAILIINSFKISEQPERPFADEDKTKMKKLFELLDFEVIVLENRKSGDLWEDLQAINREIENNCDCLACVISSHGAEIPIASSSETSPQPRHHVLYTEDNIIPTDTILQLFNDENCPNLQGKPRIFFIQACRSIFDIAPKSEVDEGYTIDLVQDQVDIDKVPEKTKETLADTHGRHEEEENNLSNCKPIEPVDFCLIPCYEDYLVMFSSSSGKLGWSDKGKGGWLMYCLFTVFEELLDTNFENFLQILSRVCGKMATDLETSHRNKMYNETKSAAVIYHMLTKDLYLRPKSMMEK
ncbi:caspase-7-like [Mytilus edulis]|uniref:caspase-7-like n=1 Tax=Mytilus edulis TaxID=6550 RepID=UPI0039EE16D6